MNFHEAFFEELEKIGQQSWLVTPRQGAREAIHRLAEPERAATRKLSEQIGVLKRFGMSNTDPQMIGLRNQLRGQAGFLKRVGQVWGPSLAIPGVKL